MLNSLNFKKGLVTSVTRDYNDKEILMVAFMNEEAVMKTLTTGVMHYWSRTRQEIWKKGQESGNKQRVKDIRIDCDSDALLFDVEPEGPACHKGYRSCFYRKVKDGNFSQIMEKKFDPDEVYE
ncbi:phosphoribosyl-AMP cyclohydrolase [candidate division MSBL1 archaeon SCGC-AAA382A13]|uniref:Phosphoribosyl-AMP cyclohydrolase n=2 Tax=candidate division MSBL1 TaxID=215777 RepID=A0A133VH13_9EURY|nr:phosphoribosyl-AMP cyclohydrolase [candidate division MSBL1 archaeon SCGC-AAA382A13]KXB05712.1 phosphoribosyl-AMP cyclohydrolase [candidate division MSBL1 archaeon SCGC-AAA382A03]